MNNLGNGSRRLNIQRVTETESVGDTARERDTDTQTESETENERDNEKESFPDLGNRYLDHRRRNVQSERQ